MTDVNNKSPTPEPADARTIREPSLSSRLRLVVAGSVALVFIIAALLVGLKNVSPQPLMRIDVEEMARQIVAEQTDGLRDELKVLTGRITQLTTKLTSQHDALEVLQGQFASIETDVAALKSVDWTQALENAQESWRAEHNAIAERTDAVETQLKRHAEVRSQSKASVRKAKTAAPTFRVVAIEYWGDTIYVMLSVGGRLALLREGDMRQGWQFLGVDADSGGALFANDKQTRNLRVGR